MVRAVSRDADIVLALADELSAVAERDVDAPIERALGLVGHFVGADRAYVFLRADDGQTVSNTHEWCAAGVAPARQQLQDLPLDTFPWAFRLLEGAEELVVPRVADAPTGPERTEWEREGIQSLFCTPLRVHGEWVGFIGCDFVRRTDALEDATQQAFRVAGVLVAGAVSRRKAWRALEYRSGFEELVLRLSSRFINLRGAQVPEAAGQAAEAVGAYVGAGEGLLVRTTEEGTLEVVHRWRADAAPVPRSPPREQALLEWRLAQVRGGQPFVLASPDALPGPLKPARGLLDAARVASLVDLPLTFGGAVRGLLGFSTATGPRASTEDEVRLLQLAAQVFSNALGRVEADLHEAQLQEQLRQTQKMEVVGQLAGGVAHDFNNLLLSMTLWAELAKRQVPAEPQSARDSLEEVLRTADSAGALTRQLLTFSRLQPSRVQALELDGLVEHHLRMLRRLVRESIRVDFRPEAGRAHVEADAVQLEQVLLNLCVNASDAMPDGGALTVATRLDTATAGDSLPAWAQPGRYVVLAVRDTGTGITQPVRERMFEPFFTTKPVGKGTGLGLSTVYAIVRQHRGFLKVTTEPGRGSTFEVWLPPAMPFAEAPGAAGGASESPARADGVLLLAEDDDQVRRAVTMVLARAGYEVLAARDGAEAVALFEKHGAQVRCAVLDAVMPGKSGLDTWRALERLAPRLPVLFTSGYSASVFPPGFFDDGRFQLLEKPYVPGVLLERVRELLAGAPAQGNR